MNTILIGLGSNMGDKRQNLTEALCLLEKSGFEIVNKSPLYQTKPWGYKDQVDFLNQAVLALSSKEPTEALDAMQDIELKLGRVRTVRYGPRTIDLDILDIKGVILNTERLTLPHPQIRHRAFVLIPVCAMLGDYVFSDGNSAKALLDELSADEKASVQALDETLRGEQ